MIALVALLVRVTNSSECITIPHNSSQIDHQSGCLEVVDCIFSDLSAVNGGAIYVFVALIGVKSTVPLSSIAQQRVLEEVVSSQSPLLLFRSAAHPLVLQIPPGPSFMAIHQHSSHLTSLQHIPAPNGRRAMEPGQHSIVIRER
jgi:hypothetical protein